MSGGFEIRQWENVQSAMTAENVGDATEDGEEDGRSQDVCGSNP